MTRTGTRALALAAAAFAVISAWMTVTQQAPLPRIDPDHTAAVQRGVAKVIAASDLPELAGETVTAALRPVAPRLGPLWALPGVAAALAALCLLRRLRGSPPPSTSRVVLPGTGARRAPPVGSFA
jgi:hypothetical protein